MADDEAINTNPYFQSLITEYSRGCDMYSRQGHERARLNIEDLLYCSKEPATPQIVEYTLSKINSRADFGCDVRQTIRTALGDFVLAAQVAQNLPEGKAIISSGIVRQFEAERAPFNWVRKKLLAKQAVQMLTGVATADGASLVQASETYEHWRRRVASYAAVSPTLVSIAVDAQDRLTAVRKETIDAQLEWLAGLDAPETQQ